MEIPQRRFLMPRKSTEADPAVFEVAGAAFMPQIELAAFLGVSQATVSRMMAKPEYRIAYDRGMAAKKLALRQKQIERALDGSDTALIWVGKNILGQADKAETKIDQTTKTVTKYEAVWGKEEEAC